MSTVSVVLVPLVCVRVSSICEHSTTPPPATDWYLKSLPEQEMLMQGPHVNIPHIRFLYCDGFHHNTQLSQLSLSGASTHTWCSRWGTGTIISSPSGAYLSLTPTFSSLLLCSMPTQVQAVSIPPSGNRPGLVTRRGDDGLMAHLRERPGAFE